MTADDEQYARRLRERFTAPVLAIDPAVIVRRGRRRRAARGAAGVGLLGVAVVMGLLLGGIPRPFGPAPADVPPPEPAGTTAALVVSPATVRSGDPVTVTILNRGQSDLVGGVGVEAQRWDGRAWTSAGWAGLCFGDAVAACQSRIDPSTADEAVPAIGIPAPPRGSSAALGLSTAGLAPGWYRLSMTVSDVSGTAARPLSAAGQFEVVAPPVPSATPASPVATPRPTVTPPDAASAIDEAVFGEAGQALVTTRGTTLLTTDAGGHWRELTVPGRRVGGHWLDVHGVTIAAATLDATGSLTYERSGDAGQTWVSQRLPLAMPDGGQVDVALDADGLMVGIAAQTPHSSGVVGTGVLFVGPTGHDVAVRPAPAAGTAAWVGTHLLLVGGVVSSQLFVSDDLGATWTQSAVEGVTVATGGTIPSDAPSIGLPVPMAADRAVIPVTLASGAAQTIDLLTTTDGRTFTSLGKVPTGGTFGPGVTARGTSAGPGTAILVGPSTTLVTVTGTDVATMTPAGLPGPVGALTFLDPTHGLASVTVTACPTGKASCTETTGLYASSDGGRTWTATRPSAG